MAVEWTTPKTDWVSTDRFNITDFSRIRNNMKWLYEKSVEIFGAIYDFVDVTTEYDPSDTNSYRQFWKVADFNAFEDNLDAINDHTLIRDYGFKQTFSVNGLFITFDELNRIESAQLDMYNRFAELKPSKMVLPVRLNHPFYPFRVNLRRASRPAKTTLPFNLPKRLGNDKTFS